VHLYSTEGYTLRFSDSQSYFLGLFGHESRSRKTLQLKLAEQVKETIVEVGEPEIKWLADGLQMWMAFVLPFLANKFQLFLNHKIELSTSKSFIF